MAVFTAQIAVGTSAVQLSATAETDSSSGQSLGILTCDVDLYLGPTNAVTTSGGTGGAKLPAGTPFSADLDSGDHLWAIAATSGTAHVVRTGV